MSDEYGDTAGPGVLALEGGFAEHDGRTAIDRCRMERTLDVIGTKSAMMLIREFFYGATRFDDLARRTGLSDAVVASRLKQLVADGVINRCPYQETGQRTRDGYRLTERGRALFPILTAMIEWGNALRDDRETAVELAHRDCGELLTTQVVCAAGHEVPLEEGTARLANEAHATTAPTADP